MKSNNFEWLLPTPVPGDSWRWGRYAGPLQVEFSPGTITWVTESLVNAEVGQRVLVRFYSGTRATIMGVLGGNDIITGTVVEYALSTSDTEAPTSDWSTTAPARTPGSFIWTRTIVSYGSGDETITGPVVLTGNDGAPGAKGDKGDTGDKGADGAEGAPGVSVESITPHFRRLAESATKPAKPTGMSPTGWVEVEPDYARDTTMWRSERVVLSNGQIMWTDVSKSSSYEAAKAAEAAALARIEETERSLEAAQQELADARTEAEQNFEELDGKLGQAFPDDIFDVDLAIEQKFSDSITGTVVEYARNSNETSAPTTGWSTTAPDRTPGTFIWMRTTVSYGSGETTTTDPVLLTGNDGAQGPQGAIGKQGPQGAKGDKGDKGDTGSDGLPGADGVGVVGTTISYARGTSGSTAPTSGWQSTPPSPIKGQYLWTRTVWTYTDGDTETGYSSAYWATDGADGTDGIAGKDGVGITGTAITYAQSTSGTTPPTSGWQPTPPSPVAGRYIWTKTVWTYSDTSTETGYTVGKIGDTGAKGDKGAEGEQGVSVSSITPHFRRLADSASKPAKPSGMSPSGWVVVEPDYARDTTMWRSDRIVFSNGQIVWTDVSKSSSYEAAKEAEAAALAYADQKKQEAIDAGALDLANLQIGGRNLALNSKAGWESTSYGVTGPQKMSEPWIVGETYTVTVKGEVNEGQQFRIWRDSGWMQFGGLTHIGNDIHRVTATATETTRDAKDEFAIYNFPSTGAESARIEWVKIERGSKATDWTPAPEDVDAGIDAAMTMANGKNAASYTDVADSVAEPGPAPTVAMGAGRPKYDVHRNRRSNGQIIGEWMWTGSAWTRLTLSDAMLSSLDVGKLTAGTANIETGVVNKLWGQLGVFDKLDVRTDAYISGVNLKDGAVTAGKLNVVYTDPDTGYGWRAEPEGITFLDRDSNPSITLRTDMKNSFSVMSADGQYLASIDEDGNVTGQTVSANTELYYKGETLTDALALYPRGVVASAITSDVGNITLTTEPSAVVGVRFTTPSTPRRWRINYTFLVRSYTAQVYVRPHHTTASQITESAPLLRSSRKMPGDGWETVTDHFDIENTSDFWSANQDVTVAVFMYTNKETATVGTSGTYPALITVEDLGPARQNDEWTAQLATPDEPAPTPPPAKKSYTYTRKASWQQSYYLSTNVKYPFYSGGVNVGDKRSYQGYYVASNGYLKSLIGFPSMTSTLSGATIKRVRLKLVNGHAGSSAGVTAVVGLHGHSSAPNTWSHSKADIVRSKHTRGSTRTVDIPSAYWAGIKSGTYKGVSLYIASTSIDYYGWWDGAQAEFIIDYEK